MTAPHLDIDPDDISTNPSDSPSFDDVVALRASRRSVLAGGMAGAAAFLTTNAFRPAPAAAAPAAGRPLLGFEAIPLGFSDEVVVPPGYTARAFIPWGTPITGSFPAFVPGGNTAAEQEQQTGMNHDGMHYFAMGRGADGRARGLLAVNHEFTEENYLQFGDARPLPPTAQWTLEMVRKSQAAHGVAVVEVVEDAPGDWSVVRSGRNRRITANTPMAFSGPAAGHRLLRTSADPLGQTPLGTFNNCSHGVTPWNTYLTCEENFNGYFRLDGGGYTAEQQALNSRYGVGGDRNRWATQDSRFVVTAADPHEPNRFGWVVEIDPFDPESRPVKRTALGRVKHESAYVKVADNDRIVVYTGDDQVNEHAYKFVSDETWASALAAGRSPLDTGTLYVARFNDDGTGDWLPLVQGRPGLTAADGFADQGEVLVKTRLAASAVGATRMDRPEWVSCDPRTGAVYLTLTNNATKTVENEANPRVPNRWGHIIRWHESGGDHTSTTFEWDLFLIAGQGRGSRDGSTIADEDAFGSPDGIWSDPDGRVWIQTDGTQPLGANDQMLAADPYFDGEKGTPKLRRFLTGPIGCEVTGVITTPDQRTMFVNIQHPGEAGAPSQWPHTDGIPTPRAATVVITKNDGGVIGT